MSQHLLQEQMNFVNSYLFSRSIHSEIMPTRWGCTIEAEGVQIVFKKKTIDIHFLEVNTHGKGVSWAWQESLCGPFNDGSAENDAHCMEWLKKALCVVQYLSYVRQITKAPEWIIFTATTRPDLTDPKDLRIRVGAWVRLNILGCTPFYKYLTGEEYAVTDFDLNHPHSDRVNYRDFSQMVNALGSPVGQSFIDGHAPNAEGNFMEGGPFTFIPAQENYTMTSNYVLPEIELEPTQVWVLQRTHAIKIRDPRS